MTTCGQIPKSDTPTWNSKNRYKIYGTRTNMGATSKSICKLSGPSQNPLSEIATSKRIMRFVAHTRIFGELVSNSHTRYYSALDKYQPSLVKREIVAAGALSRIRKLYGKGRNGPNDIHTGSPSPCHSQHRRVNAKYNESRTAYFDRVLA